MRVLVVKAKPGALEEHGLEGLAAQYELVLHVPAKGERVCDSFGQVYTLDFLHIDPPEDALPECLHRIKAAWEEASPDEAHLGHAFASTWFHYWFSPQMRSMTELIRAGMVDELRAAAKDYIDSGFGADRGPTIERVEA